jgi:16S rRNA (cytosine967-C5)-methyltransferase
VLRTFLRERAERESRLPDTPAMQSAHPEWFCQQIAVAYPQQWQAILSANNTHPPFSLRVTRAYHTPAAYLELLNAAGMPGRLVGEDGVQLDQAVPVQQLPGFADGWVSVQDIGAQRAARLMPVSAGQRVLDACAAPGGKTSHLLEMAPLQLVALDHDARRLQRVANNLERLKQSAQLKCGDAARPADWWDGQLFDHILADVPCSATGVIRRHPDIKWLRRPADVGSFARQQASILDGLWPLLKPGGTLLYATCSVLPPENEQQIAAFLQRKPDAQHESLPETGQLLPNAEHDGFYYALLRKTVAP